MKRTDSNKTSLSPIYYKDAEVDKEKAQALVARINRLTGHQSPALLNRIGGFASLYELPTSYKNPVLVTATDGVGTKIELAIKHNRDRILGIDLVAMCVNDLLCYGASPLVFLDYYASGKLQLEKLEQILSGIIEGCEAAGCLLAGGETAEMPGFYPNHSYDLAGFVAGLVEKNAIIYPCAQTSSQLIGLASSGIHANGFSLIRRLLKEKRLSPDQPCEDMSLIDALLQPTKIYAAAIKRLQSHQIPLQGIAQITGGGITENLPRALPPNAVAYVKLGKLPPLFSLIQQAAAVPAEEIYSTFNCGIGMILIVPPESADRVLGLLKEDNARILGEVKVENTNSSQQLETARVLYK